MSACSAGPISRRCCGSWETRQRRAARARRRSPRPGRFRILSAWRLPWIMRRCCTSSTAILSGLGFAPKRRPPSAGSTVSPTISPWRRFWPAGRWRWPAMRQAGLARLRQGLETFKASGAELRLPFYHGLLAEACAQAGQLGEALANISSGFAFQSQEWRGVGGGGTASHSRRSAASQWKSAAGRGQLPAFPRDGATRGRSRFRTPGSRPAARTAERRLRPSVERFQNASHVKLGL